MGPATCESRCDFLEEQLAVLHRLQELRRAEEFHLRFGRWGRGSEVQISESTVTLLERCWRACTACRSCAGRRNSTYRGTSLIRNSAPLVTLRFGDEGWSFRVDERELRVQYWADLSGDARVRRTAPSRKTGYRGTSLIRNIPHPLRTTIGPQA